MLADEIAKQLKPLIQIETIYRDKIHSPLGF